MSADRVAVTLVNTNQVEPRTVTIQAGGYAEHEFLTVSTSSRTTNVDGPHFTARLAPGTGSRLVIKMNRYALQPTLAFPWDR